MASPWRKRRLCLLVAETPVPAGLREISGRGAFVETNARPPLNATVRFVHPEAGTIHARVEAVASDGIRLAFAADSHAMGFALAATVADMAQG